MKARLLVLAVVVAGVAGAPVIAQQTFVYPAKGQSAQQQKKDEFECHTWATQQTGYDPTNPSQAAPAPPPRAGAAPGSGVRGAVGGAAIGGLVDGKDGAQTGAVVGAVAGRARSRHQQQQQASQQASAQAAGPQAYNRARSACLSGRVYNVN